MLIPSNAPILWSFRRCPFAMRARLAIAASGQVVRLREISLQDKPPAFLETSSKGTVPVLELLDGTVIDESRDIMMWALSMNDPDCWLDIWQKQPDMVKTFLDNLDGPFKNDLDRYKYASRYEVSAAGQHRQNGAQFLAELDRMLAPTGALSGSGLGFMDFASLPFIRQFRIADPDWFDAQSWPNVHQWLHVFMESSAFQRVMLKYPLWQDETDEICFP